ncbi:MAG: DUF1800 domain-containing protein [Tabrizicola sp.]|jgi:uncharacterized protein (DUF1800 family)|nr:DUF1800 domain-containing protein [Tabrizicola sp.]
MDIETIAIRFGYGLPVTVQDKTEVLALLSGPDHAVERWPGPRLADLAPLIRDYRALRKTNDEAAQKDLLQQGDQLALRGVQAIFCRALGSTDGFRERLVAFWADHFTVAPRNRLERALPAILIDEAIRPHVTGRFADMLRAVTLHPAMLIYLNQEASFGPGSPRGKRQKKGLNENLARELLELHTLGVGAAYSQTDVRELAELLTGLTIGPEGFVFDPRRAEPGAETVLGATYQGKGLEPVHQVLDDLARHSDTARHIARKLAVHFVSDTPEAGLVAALESVFRDTGGDLRAVAEALVAHPAAERPVAQKARQPFDFMIAALRALGVGPDAVRSLEFRQARRLLFDPLAAMGQPFQQASGPDGWPEGEADWITPQGLAARIDWAMAAPERLVRPLPDPRAFLSAALGSRAGDRLVWAVGAAESARDGVGLVLASPEFNRR